MTKRAKGKARGGLAESRLGQMAAQTAWSFRPGKARMARLGRARGGGQAPSTIDAMLLHRV